MSLIKLQGNASGTGALTIAAPNTNTDRTLTLPDTTGTIVMNEGSGIFKIDSSGNVGIGTSAPARMLHLSGTVPDIQYTDTTGNEWRVGNNNGVFRFYDETAAAERMRIDSSGVILVGKSASSISTVGWQLDPSGGGSIVGTVSSGTNEIFTFNNTSTTGNAQVDFRTANSEKGSITWNNTNTAFNTTSDYRLKENVAPMQNALDTVAQLNPVTYTWKADGTLGQGFIAHELQAVVPDCVTGEKDAIDEDGNPDYQGVDTSFLVATLVKAIQEQQSLITDLTARLTALEAN